MSDNTNNFVKKNWKWILGAFAVIVVVAILNGGADFMGGADR